jgi:hypothetical protein
MQQGSALRSSVVDLSAYRRAKVTEKPRPEQTPEDLDAKQAIEEISHHLLMAVQAIKTFYRQ